MIFLEALCQKTVALNKEKDIFFFKMIIYFTLFLPGFAFPIILFTHSDIDYFPFKK